MYLAFIFTINWLSLLLLFYFYLRNIIFFVYGLIAIFFKLFIVIKTMLVLMKVSLYYFLNVPKNRLWKPVG
ncbi:GlyGly-CTERM sorting domain-containing protein [Proteus columbae]|uniref:GlyGly-CTERM sorting domain-containing protein n=1 Tax=Proteus columbae TaxID=1987580 RepID=A0A6I7DHY1_9GAMM|nr:GlyGly-CTERM sorting domain-containing protein [Proteus columbae]